MPSPSLEWANQTDLVCHSCLAHPERSLPTRWKSPVYHMHSIHAKPRLPAEACFETRTHWTKDGSLPVETQNWTLNFEPWSEPLAPFSPHPPTLIPTSLSGKPNLLVAAGLLQFSFEKETKQKKLVEKEWNQWGLDTTRIFHQIQTKFVTLFGLMPVAYPRVTWVLHLSLLTKDLNLWAYPGPGSLERTQQWYVEACLLMCSGVRDKAAVTVKSDL